MTKLAGRLKKCGPYFFLVIIPICNFYLMEFYTHNPFTTMKLNVHIMNIVLFEAMALFFFGLFGRINIALIVQTLFSALYGLAGYFVLEFRGAPIQPWDILSLSTAASVAQNYEYKLDRDAVLVLIGFCVVLGISAFQKAGFSSRKKENPSPQKATRLKILLRLLCAACSFLVLFGYTRMLHDEDIVQNKLKLYDKLFTPTTIQYKNGTLTAFLMELQYLSVEKPDGYSKESAAALLAAYEQEATESAGTGASEMPNIIVIMNEAFSDPAVLGDFTTNEDYMPFIHSMLAGAENTISGTLNVSVKGGNTANTEFEYLTGSTMAFLPYGSVPYQQYVKDETPTITSHLKSLGYRTVAMHPYRAGGWDRDTVYPYFGFDECYFQEFYKDSAKIRKYVSDLADYEKILKIYNSKQEGEPLFLFNVTMQNHSSYSDWAVYDNFTPDITVEGSNSKLLPAYLSLMKLSDQAIEALVNYFSEEEENTIIVFFGDHQPTDSIVNPVLKFYGKTCEDLSSEEETLRYVVPFFIWANYDIEEQSGINTSPNFLAAKTLQAAGLPMSAYFNCLSGLYEQIPVISATHVRLADGTFTDVKEQSETLNDYQTLQYYLLFDQE